MIKLTSVSGAGPGSLEGKKNGANAPFREPLRSMLAVELCGHLVCEVDFLDFDTLAHFKANKGDNFGAGTRYEFADGKVGLLDECLL